MNHVNDNLTPVQVFETEEMDFQEEEVRSEATFHYTFENVSKMKGSQLSPPCYVRNLPWKIMVMPCSTETQERQPQRSLGFYLQCNGESKSSSWSCYAYAELRLLSCKAGQDYFSKKMQHSFCSKENGFGYSHFMAWQDALDPDKGYIKDDSITLEVHIVADAPHGVSWDSEKHTKQRCIEMSKEGEFKIRWDVKNMELFWKEKVSLISPTFLEKKILHTHRLRLIITRALETGSKEESTEGFEEATEKGYMSLYLQQLSFENCKNYLGRILNVTVSLIHPVRGEIVRQSEIEFYEWSRIPFGFDRFISMKKLKDCGLSFTIICKFKVLKQDFKSYGPFFNEKASSDINLIVGLDEIQTFPAHKLILALGSHHFQYILALDKSISFFKIQDMKPEVVTEILRYIYTGKAIYTENIVYELFEAALHYRVYSLRSNCHNFLVENLNLANVVRTLLSCRKHRNFFYTSPYLKELIVKCMSLIDEQLDEVIRVGLCKELLKKEPQILTEIVAHLSTSNFLKEACVAEESCTCSQCFKEMFESFAKSSDFSDIVIQVNDSEFPAHKLILSARSPVFKRMFSHNMRETTSGVVTVEDIRPPIFEKLLGFMYTNEMESEDDDIQEILIASDKYEMNDLKLTCEKILEEKLTADNVITTIIFAADHNAERLKKKCLRFITHAGSPFWSDSSEHFSLQKLILNENLVESRPHLLYEMVTEIHQQRFS